MYVHMTIHLVGGAVIMKGPIHMLWDNSVLTSNKASGDVSMQLQQDLGS